MAREYTLHRPPASAKAIAYAEELNPQQLKTFMTGKEKKEEGDKAFKAGDPKEGIFRLVLNRI